MKKRKVLIVCSSSHHHISTPDWVDLRPKDNLPRARVCDGNTEKIAKAMAKILDAKLVKTEEVGPATLEKISNYDFDLIGFGSGVYFSKLDKNLLDLVDRLPQSNGKLAFIFSTSGLPEIKFVHGFSRSLKNKLLEKKFVLVGEFSCRGHDTNGFFLKLIGGIHKGRPDEKDINAAEAFARNLKEKLEARRPKSS
ncbi:MAG: flavodoxin family protein [Candidatus Micrarchaeota archaeon]|nr:flavodoxin family protein [Candidatus Micrarchaeota archaeon]